MPRPSILKFPRALLFTLIVTVCASLHATAVLVRAEEAFVDPYAGGEKLPHGGGAPGAAYMAFVDAAKHKDLGRMCEMLAGPAMKDKCLEKSALVDGYAYYLSQPERQEVLEGYRSGDEATLNVAFINPSSLTSTGYVVMAQIEGRWVLTKFGGSGSGTVSAQAQGEADLGSRSNSGGDEADESKGPVIPEDGPLLGSWTFEGKDDKGVLWKGTLTVSALNGLDYDGGENYTLCAIETQSESSGSGAEANCSWDGAKREVALVIGSNVAYRAHLSEDRRDLTNGKWTEGDRDYSTGKVTVKRTGVWSAKFNGQ